MNKNNIEKIKKIMELGCVISTSNIPDVFVHYEGHVNALSVRIYYEGWVSEDDLVDIFKSTNTILSFSEWKEKRTKLKYFSYYFNDGFGDKLEKIIEELEGLLLSITHEPKGSGLVKA